MEKEKKEHHHKDKFTKKISLGDVFIILSVVLAIILAVNTFLTFSLKKDLTEKAEAAKEILKPAEIELTIIKNSRCSDCFDISSVASYIKSAKVNATKERTLEFDSKEGRDLISKYKIEKVPTIVITGEIDKVNIEGLEKKENALLLTKLEPPYTNAATGKIEGKVAMRILKDSACAKCNDLSSLVNQIKLAGIKVSEEKNVDTNSDEGKNIIKKYNLGFAPTLILSKDADAYDIIKQAWPNVGTKESDGSYVLRMVYPPFINLTTGALKGVINIIYLTDKSCADCYDVNQHRIILVNPQGFAISLDKEETIDISDSKGKELVFKYNITQAPTIILSSEISDYPSSLALKQFFSVEKDGSYVFRKDQVVGTYKDLATNQVVKVQQQQQEE